MSQIPRQGHLCQRLPTRLGHAIQAAYLVQLVLRHVLGFQEPVRLGGPGALRDTAQVLVCQQSLCEGREHDAANLFLREHIQKPVFDPAVEHVVGRLVNETRRAQLSQDTSGLPCLLRAVGRDADIQRLTLPDNVIQSAHRLLKGCVGIRTVAVKDVDIV